MTIDFSPFAKAIQQLEKSLEYATSDLAKNNAGLLNLLTS